MWHFRTVYNFGQFRQLPTLKQQFVSNKMNGLVRSTSLSVEKPALKISTNADRLADNKRPKREQSQCEGTRSFTAKPSPLFLCSQRDQSAIIVLNKTLIIQINQGFQQFVH